jgi:hypothetical protein
MTLQGFKDVGLMTILTLLNVISLFLTIFNIKNKF